MLASAQFSFGANLPFCEIIVVDDGSDEPFKFLGNTESMSFQ